MFTWFIHLLKHPTMLWLVLVINILGTIYGYIWYGYQLAETPAIFIAFVPDSPTASLFFCFVLLGFIFRRNYRIFEALAIVTLVKYGIWAVVMNILTFLETGYLPIEGYMLIVSHGAMAVQGILYSPYYRFEKWHLVVAGIWTLHNDIIDYVFGMMPRYGSLMQYMPEIGYFTFWLSIFSIAIAYYFSLRQNRYELSIK
ncbi:DUF1405 domain-containing protein [Sutcliffiella rhizosphaerae]|uniref:DUF1405 domain-containing protein n=1 Tax=Sutcliffiella rhizosphaerae TaxID=2880967 RepID=A0ABN8AEU4_9BACI|nr:DUF1405 domain-containing protein [Sutcliffiella rhizosphaerae]CAG9622637.1 hypothetical protein BACCIP111883_03428 [Sutcliffiella rhizosphaerae]